MTGQTTAYIEWQQRRGMMADTVKWAINEYNEYMKDDNYNAQAVLDRIVLKLVEADAIFDAAERA